ncbi:MAG: NIL domain-containing protein [Acidimicrobiales bacterium]
MPARVRLTFPEELIREPVVSTAVKRFDITVNIRRASIEGSIGWIVAEIGGSEAAVEEAIAWMSEAGVQVDLLGDVVEG